MKTRQLIIFTFVAVTCKCCLMFKKSNDDESKKAGHIIRLKSNFLDPEEITNGLTLSDTNKDEVLSAEEISHFFGFVIGFSEEDANSIALFLIKRGDKHNNKTHEKDEKLDKNELFSEVEKIDGQLTD